jgi:hypothetical protein
VQFRRTSGTQSPGARRECDRGSEKRRASSFELRHEQGSHDAIAFGGSGCSLVHHESGMPVFFAAFTLHTSCSAPILSGIEDWTRWSGITPTRRIVQAQ